MLTTLRRIKKELEESGPVYAMLALSIFLIIMVAIGFVHSLNTDRVQTEVTGSGETKGIYEYEVMSVFQYTETKTNSIGAVLATNVCYAFTYIDENGDLQSVQGFRDLKGGLTKVSLSQDAVDRYIVVCSGLTEYRILSLSKETLQNLTFK